MSQEATRRALSAVAAAEQLLVGVDYDGTLSELVRDPAAARPDPAALAALRAVARLPRTDVTIISGRARADLLKFLDHPPEFRLIGSHGAEREDGTPLTLSPTEREIHERIAAELERLAGGCPGALVERKPAAVAFHYRQCDPLLVKPVLRAVLNAPVTHDAVDVLHGGKVIEYSVRPMNKGDALRDLRARLGSTHTIFIGDDRTDEFAFAVLNAFDLGVKVGPGPTLAQARVADVAGVAAFLAELIQLREHSQRKSRPALA